MWMKATTAATPPTVYSRLVLGNRETGTRRRYINRREIERQERKSHTSRQKKKRNVTLRLNICWTKENDNK